MGCHGMSLGGGRFPTSVEVDASRSTALSVVLLLTLQFSRHDNQQQGDLAELVCMSSWLNIIIIIIIFLL